MRIVYFILVIALLSGCERTPSKLAHQIAGADRIVIRDSLERYHPELSGFSFTITGDKVDEIVRAISSSERLNGGTLCAWDGELLFYSDTNCLAIVHFQDDYFIICGEFANGYEYADRSGVLAHLYGQYHAYQKKFILSHSKPVPPNTALEPTPTAP
jgi:hypothetical protein